MKDTISRIIDFNAAISPDEPKSYTANVVVYETAMLQLLMYREDMSAPATLIITPDAGHGGIGIADKGKNQSLVHTMHEAQPGSIFHLEWKTATQETKGYGIEEIIEEIRKAVAYIPGDKIHIFGLCAGGWKATIYTAMYPETVSRLSINGTPIDFRLGDGHLTKMVDKLGSDTYHKMVKSSDGVMSGKKLLLGWEMLNFFDRFIIDFQKIWNSTLEGRGEEYTRHTTHRAWYKNTRDLPGVLYLQTIDELFIANKLIKNELYVGDTLVDLTKIKCRVDLINGDKDEITLTEQCFALADYISTPVGMITKTIITGGCKKGCGYDGLDKPSCNYKGSDNPDCNYKGVGHIGGFCSKKAQPIIHNIFNTKRGSEHDSVD